MSEHQEGFRLRIDEVETTVEGTADRPSTPLTYNETFPEAEATFRNSVEDVRLNGDELDKRPSLQWRRIATQAILPAALAAELSVASNTPSPWAVGAVGAGVAASTWLNVRKDRGQQKHQARHRQWVNNKTGQDYEIYRPVGHADAKDAPLSLVWYGHKNPDLSIQKNLLQMAKMAQEHGIITMHVDADLQFSLGLTIRDHALTSIDQVMWREKRLGISGEKNFISRTPKEWVQKMSDEKKETREVYDPPTKKNILARKLNAVRPGHPLVPILRSNDLVPPLVSPNNRKFEPPNPIKNAARSAVHRRLNRTGFYPEFFRQGILQGRNVYRHEASRREAAKLSPDAKTVLWNTPHGFSRQDIMAALEIKEDEYVEIINFPLEDGIAVENPDKVQAILELAALRLAHGQSIPLGSETKQIEIAAPHRPDVTTATSILDALRNRRDSRIASTYYHRIAQFGTATIAMFALTVGFEVIHDQLDARNDRAVQQATTQLAIERNVLLDGVPDDDAQERVNEKSTVLRAWNAFRDAEDTINKSWPDLKSTLSKPGESSEVSGGLASATSQEHFSIGNIDRSGKDIDQFHIESFRGADPTGFWASGTSSQLNLHSDEGKLLAPDWTINTDINDKGPSLYPRELPQEYADTPHFKVTRPIFESQQGGDQNGVYGYTSIGIAVLEGTKPVAVQINGKQSEIFRKNDNTYIAETAAGQKIEGELEYWLVVDKNAPRAKATGPLRIAGDPEVFGVEATNIHQKLDSEKSVLSDDGKTAAEIAKNWKYAYSPFTEKQQASWKTMDDFIRDAEKNRLANCNVGNTIANIKDPTDNQVIGFQNTPGSKKNALSIHELHQKMTRADATPSTASAISPNANKGKVPEIPYVPIALIAAGVATFTQRRRLVRTPGKVVALIDDRLITRKTMTFARHDGDSYVAASALAEHTLYARRQPITEEAWNAAIQRVDRTYDTKSDALLERPDIVRPATIQHLSDLATTMEKIDPELAIKIQKSTAIITDAHAVLEVQAGKRIVAERIDRLKCMIGSKATAIKASSARLTHAIRTK